MKFYFDGPMCFITEIGDAKKCVNILVPRLVKDSGDFRMNLSAAEPDDGIHWVSVYISKKNMNGEKVIKPVHIECNSYEEVISLVDSLQSRHGTLVKQFRIEKKKPWLRVHRQQVERETKV
jgi:hypothetical protein